MAPDKPKPGDLIEIFRFGYEHWAIYVGDGYVVHLAPPGDNVGIPSANLMSSGTLVAVVKKELLSKVAGKDKYRVNNKNDRKHRPRPPSEIVQRATKQVGRKMSYKLTSANCEHFVNDLRYGVPHCGQVTRGIMAAGLWIAGMAGSAALGPALGISALGAAGVYGIATLVTDLACQQVKKL